MKLRMEIDGQSHALEIRPNGAGLTEYALDNGESGVASIEEVMPGVFSILLGTRSFTVNVVAQGEEFEVVSDDRLPRVISVADARDRPAQQDAGAVKGPAIIRAQMPGKIIKLLVQVGDRVEAGQGLIVVEAMKMQNEVKAPKNAVVTKIHVVEGATVSAGETLVVVE